MSKYDIIAVIPEDEKLFQDCCKEIDCDLISFDQNCNFTIRRGSVQSAIAQNIQFEFNYRYNFYRKTIWIYTHILRMINQLWPKKLKFVF